MATTPNHMPYTKRGAAPLATSHATAPAPVAGHPITGHTQPIAPLASLPPAPPARAITAYRPPAAAAQPAYQAHPTHAPHMPQRQPHVTNNYQQTIVQQAPQRQSSGFGSVLPLLATGLGIGLGARVIGGMMNNNRPAPYHSHAPQYGTQHTSQYGAQHTAAHTSARPKAMHPHKFDRILNAAINQRDTWINPRTGREESIPTGDKQQFKKEVHDILRRNEIHADPNAFFVRNILDRQFMSPYELRQAPIGHRIGSEAQDFNDHFGKYTFGAGGQMQANSFGAIVQSNLPLLQQENARDYSRNSQVAHSHTTNHSGQFAYATPQRHVTNIRIF